MRTRPAWFVYAVEIKAKINRLRSIKDFAAERIRILAESYQTASSVHTYPGTPAEWEYVVENTSADPP